MGFQEFPVETCYVLNADTLRTLQFACSGIGTVTESELVHFGNHVSRPLGCFRSSLGKECKRTYAGCYEEHRRTVLTGGDTCSAAYASRSIHALFCLVMANENCIRILCRTCADRYESAGLENLVESRTVNDKVLYNRECSRTERLYRYSGTVLKMTHEKLAGGNPVIWSVRTAVYKQAACAADSFPAVVIERNGTAALASTLDSHRIGAFANKLLIEDIKHFQEGSVAFNPAYVIGFEMSFALGVLLTPYLEIEFHTP